MSVRNDWQLDLELELEVDVEVEPALICHHHQYLSTKRLRYDAKSSQWSNVAGAFHRNDQHKHACIVQATRNKVDMVVPVPVTGHH